MNKLVVYILAVVVMAVLIFAYNASKEGFNKKLWHDRWHFFASNSNFAHDGYV